MKEMKLSVTELFQLGEFPEEDREDLSEKYDFLLWSEDGCIYGVKGGVAYDVYFDCGFPEKIPE